MQAEDTNRTTVHILKRLERTMERKMRKQMRRCLRYDVVGLRTLPEHSHEPLWFHLRCECFPTGTVVIETAALFA